MRLNNSSWLTGGTVLLVAAIGIGFGLAAEDDPTLSAISPVYARVSSVVGWTYFGAWSVSFYPQLYLNWSRRSVAGLSLDFLLYNLVGFTFYSVYACSFFWNAQIQDAYKLTYGSANDVAANDVFFALHAVLITVLTLGQCVLYDRAGQRVSRTCLFLVSAMVSAAAAYAVLLWSWREPPAAWLSYLYFLSSCKLLITLIKYVPQAWMNYKRKSTVGWSIGNILLDFTGGSLSLLQSFMSAWVRQDWTVAFGNPIRPLLGLYSISFDIIFMLQHYVWFKPAGAKQMHASDKKDHGSHGWGQDQQETDRLIPDPDEPLTHRSHPPAEEP